MVVAPGLADVVDGDGRLWVALGNVLQDLQLVRLLDLLYSAHGLLLAHLVHHGKSK